LAEDILDEINDEFDDDSLDDMFDDVLNESSEEIRAVEKDPPEKETPDKTTSKVKKIIGSKKTILIAAVLLIVLIGIAAGGRLFFLKDNTKKTQPVENETVEGDARVNGDAGLAREREIVFKDIVYLEPFERIRFKSGSTMRSATISLSLELTDENYRKQIVAMEDRIREIIKGQVQEMTWLELRNPEGKIRLKYNLLKRVNSIFPKAVIRNIYFTNFIMQ